MPLGGGDGWKGEREQDPGCKTRQKTRVHYVTSLRKSVAKSDLVTLPDGSWNVALKPSLFARRMNVIFRSGSFSRSDEYAFADVAEMPDDTLAAMALHEPSEPHR